jgi:3-carboxy-cis,cis-muconate cycloisomerase
MGQEHERGLGNWQAELAEWPGLFLSAHGAIVALAEAFDGLVVDAPRMLRNIDDLQGLIFAEAVSIYLAAAIGRPAAHSLMEELTRKAVAEGIHLSEAVAAAESSDPRLSGKIDRAELLQLFDPVAATLPAQALASRQLQHLQTQQQALPPL